MSDPTTQPVGALPDPELLERASEAFAAYMHENGVTDDTPVETDLPVLFALAVCVQNGTNSLFASLMAERDAAREEAAGLRARLTERNFKCASLELLVENGRAVVDEMRSMTMHCEQWRNRTEKAEAEAAALRRELEELRKAGAPMANTMFNLAQRDSIPAHERESFKSMQVAWDAALRAIPPDARDCTDGDGHFYAAVSKTHATPELNAAVEASIDRAATVAREGREPQWQPIETAPKDMASYMFLCSGVAMQGFRDATGELCVCQEEGTKRWRSMRRKPTHWMPLPIGPAGTSADGETQP